MKAGPERSSRAVDHMLTPYFPCDRLVRGMLYRLKPGQSEPSKRSMSRTSSALVPSLTLHSLDKCLIACTSQEREVYFDSSDVPENWLYMDLEILGLLEDHLTAIETRGANMAVAMESSTSDLRTDSAGHQDVWLEGELICKLLSAFKQRLLKDE